MDADYPIDYEAVTPEYVLAVLQEMHRRLCAADCGADRDVTLSFETTVREWIDADDLCGTHKLGMAFNDWWDINCSWSEWQAILEPSKKRTLSDVCRLIAQHAKRVRIHPLRVLGCESEAAGAFLAIRQLLHNAGADVDQIGPSTPLDRYTGTYRHIFEGPIARLAAPEAIPSIRIHHPVDRPGCAVFAALWALCWITVFCGRGMLAIGIFVLPLSSLIVFPVLNSFFPPRVKLGNLKTFKELAIALSDRGRALAWA